MISAAWSGNLNLLQYLHQDLHFELPKYAIPSAAGGGHIEVIEWLLQHKVPLPQSDTYREAASNGRLEVIKYLRAKHNIAFGFEPLEIAETHLHFDVVKFIVETGGDKMSPSPLWLNAAAAGNGRPSLPSLTPLFFFILC